MPFLYSSLVVAAATPPALLALFHVHTKLFMATRKAVFTLAVPESFLASRHLRIINPRQHMIATDAVTLKIRRPLGMSDEELLARFARGFFGRRTFMVERTFFRIIGLRMVGFTGNIYIYIIYTTPSLLHPSPISHAPVEFVKVQTAQFFFFLEYSNRQDGGPWPNRSLRRLPRQRQQRARQHAMDQVAAEP